MAMIDQELDEQKKERKRERELMRAQLLAANQIHSDTNDKEQKITIASVRPFQISTHYTEDDKDAVSLCAMNIRKNSEIKNPKNEEIVHAAVLYYLSLPLEKQIKILREDRKLIGRAK